MNLVVWASRSQLCLPSAPEWSWLVGFTTTSTVPDAGFKVHHIEHHNVALMEIIKSLHSRIKWWKLGMTE